MIAAYARELVGETASDGETRSDPRFEATEDRLPLSRTQSLRWRCRVGRWVERRLELEMVSTRDLG
jgi:hypothetical protein